MFRRANYTYLEKHGEQEMQLHPYSEFEPFSVDLKNEELQSHVYTDFQTIRRRRVLNGFFHLLHDASTILRRSYDNLHYDVDVFILCPSRTQTASGRKYLRLRDRSQNSRGGKLILTVTVR